MSLSMGNMSGMSGMSGIGHMSMSPGVPDPFYLQRMYWAVVGSAIGAATVVNLYNYFLSRQR